MENKERELNMDEMEKASGGTMPDNNLPNQRVEDVLAILHVEPDQGGGPASQPDEEPDDIPHSTVFPFPRP